MYAYYAVYQLQRAGYSDGKFRRRVRRPPGETIADQHKPSVGVIRAAQICSVLQYGHCSLMNMGDSGRSDCKSLAYYLEGQLLLTNHAASRIKD